VAGDILQFPEFFVPDERLSYDAEAFDKHVGKPGAAELLAGYRDALPDIDPFDAATLDAFTHRFVEQRGIKIGEIIHAIRVAVTGKSIGLGLFDAMAVLGKASTITRINQALGRAHESRSGFPA
jgi:glutamyl-tRNA synthetase